MTPSFLPGKRTMKLRMATGPMGVSAVKVSSSTWSCLKCSRRKDSALAWPGLVGQRGPMAANWRAYSRARGPSKWLWAVAGLQAGIPSVATRSNPGHFTHLPSFARSAQIPNIPSLLIPAVRHFF